MYAKLKKDVDPRSRSCRNPIYNARKEFRWQSEKAWDPTMTIVIQVNGLEKISPKGEYETNIIGFAVINVFVDPETGEQPLDESISEFVLNEGAFQIPIMRSGLPQNRPLSMKVFDGMLRRLCSSLLVRIVHAPRSNDGLEVLSAKTAVGGQENLERLGLLVHPKPYKKGVYTSLGYCEPTPMEERVYPLRLESEAKTAMTVQMALLAAGEDALSLAQEHSLKDYKPYDQHSYSDELKVVAARVKSALQTHAGSTPRFMNPNMCIPHNIKTGFMISIDGVNNLQKEFLYSGIFAVISPFPPGTYYNSKGKITHDIHVVRAMNYEAEKNKPRWNDGFLNFSFGFEPKPDNPFLSLIIDVRAFVTKFEQHGRFGVTIKDLAAPQVKQLGYAFLPIFGDMGAYTLSGNYQLPLFAMGADPQLDVKAYKYRFKSMETFQAYLNAPEGPNNYLLEKLTLSASKPGYPYEGLREVYRESDIHFVKGMSVLCRVVDGTRAGEFATPWGVNSAPQKINFDYIPPNKESEYFDLESTKRMADVLSKEIVSTHQHQNEILHKFMQALGLEHELERLDRYQDEQKAAQEQERPGESPGSGDSPEPRQGTAGVVPPPRDVSLN